MVQRGVVISGLVAVLAVVGLASVFVMNASPYMTITEAKASTGDSLHVAGDFMKASLKQDLARREAYFVIDDGKDTLEVVYRGKPQPNLASATKVVVIGKMDNQRFVADDMLLKCPSKYESEKGARGTQQN